MGTPSQPTESTTMRVTVACAALASMALIGSLTYRSAATPELSSALRSARATNFAPARLQAMRRKIQPCAKVVKVEDSLETGVLTTNQQVVFLSERQFKSAPKENDEPAILPTIEKLGLLTTAENLGLLSLAANPETPNNLFAGSV